MENSKNPEQLVEILDNFFAQDDFLAEEFEEIKENTEKGEVIEGGAHRVKSEETVIEGFEKLVSYWEAAPKGSNLGKKIEQQLREYLEICRNKIEVLAKFSHQVSIGTLPEKLLGEVLKNQLELDKFDDVLKLEKYRRLVLLGSEIETIILRRQLAVLEEDKGLIEAIETGSIENLPAWFVRMLEMPELIPSDLKLVFITKARQVRRTLKLPQDEVARGLFAQGEVSLSTIVEEATKITANPPAAG